MVQGNIRLDYGGGPDDHLDPGIFFNDSYKRKVNTWQW